MWEGGSGSAAEGRRSVRLVTLRDIPYRDFSDQKLAQASPPDIGASGAWEVAVGVVVAMELT
eukprot:6265511-Alexandrium_andersonii.AAC.1